MNNVYSSRKRRREKVLNKCSKMREAKERMRLARVVSVESHVIGVVTFEGALFGGIHVVRFVGRSDRPVVDVEVDGQVTCVKTPRGARALVMRRVYKCVAQQGGREGHKHE